MLSIFMHFSIPIITPDLIFVHNGTFTTSVILCCTNTFGRLVYSTMKEALIYLIYSITSSYTAKDVLNRRLPDTYMASSFLMAKP